MKYNLLAIIGPTAVGKTAAAVRTALRLGGEILSADSRQVYRGMDIGTGKDLDEYRIDGHSVPFHLIDIAAAGEQYNIHRYQKDFLQAFRSICARGRVPVLCGGSGLYIEAVTKGYALPEVPANPALRRTLETKSDDELSALLQSMKTLHNTTDTDSRKRTIRGIEIAMYFRDHPAACSDCPPLHTLFIGLQLPVEERRARIAERLHRRLQQGLVEEVERLLQSGLQPDELIYYGLEYKFVTLYLTRQIGYDAMVEQLNIAIRQFAKRQMTWFRGMERRGTVIHWMDAALPAEEIAERAAKLFELRVEN